MLNGGGGADPHEARRKLGERLAKLRPRVEELRRKFDGLKQRIAKLEPGSPAYLREARLAAELEREMEEVEAEMRECEIAYSLLPLSDDAKERKQ